MPENDFSEKRTKMLRIIEQLKNRMKELDELEKEIKNASASKTPGRSVAVLEEIIVPALSALREKEEKKQKKQASA